MKKIYMFAFVALIACIGGCSSQPVRGKIEKVNKVFMHTPTDYSVMWQNSYKLDAMRFDSGKIEICVDVPADQSMWVEYKGSKSGNNYTFESVQIHIHSPSDLNAAAAPVKSGSKGSKGDKTKTMLTTVIADDPTAKGSSHSKNERHISTAEINKEEEDKKTLKEVK